MQSIKEGEKLMLLVKRDSRTTQEIADVLGIDKSYLPRLYKMDILPRKPLQKAMVVFNVPATYFTENGETYSGVEERNAVYGSVEKRLQAENAALREENGRLHKILEQEKSINAHLAEALANLSKRTL